MISSTGRLPLSVVIAANHAEGVLGECLAALTAQVQPGVAEVIVVAHSAQDAAANLQARFPSVCWVHLDAPASLAEALPKFLLRRPARLAFLRSEANVSIPLAVVPYGAAPAQVAARTLLRVRTSRIRIEAAPAMTWITYGQ